MNFNSHVWAAISIVVMVVVIVFMDWVPTPLNYNIKRMSVRERLPGSLIHSTIGLIFAVLNLLALKWFILVGALWFSVVLFSAIQNWWLAYFGGIYRGEITPEIYAQHYAHNVTILPKFNGNPVVPDVQHMLIHLAVLSASLLSWVSFLTA